ncbi:MFS transporter [Phenylobacterium sp.]|uniref:MFS transporter n=1 Tax=Phenylobacterium sp. TaxID=1871053 RepID=UPI0037837227
MAAISLLGTSIEWYDFFLYGVAAAVVFPKLFFAGDLPPLVALFAAFATFAVGFLARPVGGVIFGHFGDRLGRKGTLVTALIMMGAATTLIGLTPSYASIGFWAPTILVALRFVQGLAIGGQWGGAMLLVTESAPSNKRGLYGSFAQAGVPMGVVLANLALLVASSTLSEDDFLTWGWRIPFILSVVLVGVALYVQLRLEETQAFRRLKDAAEAKARDQSAVPKRTKSPILQVLASHPRQVVLAAGTFICTQVAFYILIAFTVAYGTSRASGPPISRDTMLLGVLVGSIVMVPAIFLSGALSDRFGRRGIFMAGAALLGLWSFAIFPLIDTGQLIWIIVAISAAQIFTSMMYGPQAAFFTELFSTEVRYSGASLGYQLGAILGGALAPLVATALLARFGTSLAISIYMAAAAAISLLSVTLLRETYRSDL